MKIEEQYKQDVLNELAELVKMAMDNPLPPWITPEMAKKSVEHYTKEIERINPIDADTLWFDLTDEEKANYLRTC